MNARPITWPTVPKGGERVRVCLHSGNTREEVKGLAEGVVEWAKEWIREREGGGGEEGERESGVCVVEESDVGRKGEREEGGRTVIVQSKL